MQPTSQQLSSAISTLGKDDFDHNQQPEHGHDSDHEHKEVNIHIFVNHKPVDVQSRKLTGLQIKQAAIFQQVAIQPEFVLFQVIGQGVTKAIGDTDLVEVHDDSCFDAIPNDDNS